MARGDRFARGREPQRDAAGHSLPSDRSMHYVELQIVCRVCIERERVILGAWWIESYFPTFIADQVNERANSAVTTQLVPDGQGGTRTRYELRCPKCGQKPVLRQDTVDAALGAIYEQDARAKVVTHRL